jgi:hypothetical protein
METPRTQDTRCSRGTPSSLSSCVKQQSSEFQRSKFKTRKKFNDCGQSVRGTRPWEHVDNWSTKMSFEIINIENENHIVLRS